MKEDCRAAIETSAWLSSTMSVTMGCVSDLLFGTPVNGKTTRPKGDKNLLCNISWSVGMLHGQAKSKVGIKMPIVLPNDQSNPIGLFLNLGHIRLVQSTMASTTMVYCRKDSALIIRNLCTVNGAPGARG